MNEGIPDYRSAATRAPMLAPTLSLGLCGLALMVGTASPGQAETLELDIEMSSAQIEALGIETDQPRALAAVTRDSAPARITLPPTADHLVTSATAGLVTALEVATGSRVSQGDPLATVISPDIVSLERDFVAARSAARLARSEYERDHGLHAAGVIAARRLDATRARLEEMTARESAQRSLLRLAGLEDADIERLEAGDVFSASLTLRAPGDGVVTAQLVQIGERIEAHTPLYRLASMDRLWVEARVPHERFGNVAVGDVVHVVPGGHPARVISVGGIVDPDDQTLMVRAELNGVPGDLRPGQFVTARLGAAAVNAVQLPGRAVVTRDGQAYVFVRTDGGFSARAVSVGVRAGNVVTIAAGVDPGMRVAVAGTSALKAAWIAAGNAP